MPIFLELVISVLTPTTTTTTESITLPLMHAHGVTSRQLNYVMHEVPSSCVAINMIGKGQLVCHVHAIHVTIQKCTHTTRNSTTKVKCDFSIDSD